MAAQTTPIPEARSRAIGWSDLLDAATYWAGIAATYISFGFLWFYAAKEKLFDDNGTMPAGLAKPTTAPSSTTRSGSTPPGCCSAC